MTSIRLLVLCGSARAGSLNRRLAAVAGEAARQAGAEVTELDLRALLFADAASVSNRQGDPCLNGRSRCRVAGLGLGLRAGWQAWQLRLDVARAMNDANLTRKGDVRAHFSLSTEF